MSVIELEPKPRAGAVAKEPLRFGGECLFRFPAPLPLPDKSFSQILEARRSAVGGELADQQLGDVLHNVTRRMRGGLGRFGQAWEGRASPAAGGLHVISLLCLPVERTSRVGFYDRNQHSLRQIEKAPEIQRVNAESVKLLTGATSGTTIQFLADAARLNSCYENGMSLLWRDSGALAATICLVATCFGLNAVILGRTGSGLDLPSSLSGWQPLGAVHLGRPT